MNAGMQVEASPWTIRVVWCAIVWLYVVCATFLAYQAAAYFYILAYAIPLLGNLELLSIGVSRAYYRTIGGVYLAIAVVHALSLLEILFGSMWQRQLVFKISTSRPGASVSRRIVVRSFEWLVSVLEPVLPPPTSRRRRFVRFLGRSALFVWRAFGVTNPNYGVVYIIRELIQTGIQTYQAYRLSALVAREWMNQVIVVLLVLNCWATPIIQFTLRSSPGSTRLICLMVNVALDFVSYIVFPVALFLPYYAQFDPAIGNYEQSYWYTDVWLIQVINEWQMLFVSSFWDAISKFFIAYNITRSLRSIPRLLRHRDVPSGDRAPAPQVSLVERNRASNSAWAIVPAPSAPAQQPKTPRLADTTKSSSRLIMGTRDKWRHRFEHLGHRLLAMWGLVVLACHIQSAITDDNEQCLVQVRPWFTTRPVCSLLEINCDDGKQTGNELDFNHAIDSIQTEWLAYLIIRDCSAVEITPRIHELPWLIALKMYNSTLHRWDDAAALTQTHNPQMIFVFMAVIKADAIPPGLYSADFPQKLNDIELSDWNVTSLPDRIAEVWHPGMFLVIEKFAFSEFPPALTRLRPGYLSISFNNFTEIPPPLWQNDGLIFLNLNGNPITSLPAEPWTSQLIVWLCTVETQIAQMPVWISPTTVAEFMAGSTPFCSSLATGDAAALGASESEMAAWERFVNCTPAGDYHYLTHFPLVDENVNNPPRAH